MIGLFSQLRARDYDAFLVLGFAPQDQRDDLARLVLFFQDMLAIPARASEPMLAGIKLSWWRDAIADLQQGVVRSQPDLEAFAAMQMPAEQCAVLMQMIEHIGEAQHAEAHQALWQVIMQRLGEGAAPCLRAREIIAKHRIRHGQRRAFSLLLKLLFAR